MAFIKTRFNPGDRIWWVHYQTENPDEVVPMCMSCYYNDYLKHLVE